MESVWITNGSDKIAPVVNPLAAGCDAGFVPDRIRILDNPTISSVTERALTPIGTIVSAYGGTDPEIEVESIEAERDFDAIADFLRESIAAGQEAGAEVAIDVTPGRKFWSIISFQAGIEFGVDHLYYVHLPGRYFGESYPTVPRPALTLVDFTEEF